LLWIDTDRLGERAYERTPTDGSSRINQAEAHAILALLEKWLANEKFLEWLTTQTKHDAGIGVICMYAAQRDLVRRVLTRSAFGHLVGHQIRIGTVDSYQGKQNPITIVSLVRNNVEGPTEDDRKTIREGFLSTPNRIPVMANSRELVECMAELTREPLSRVVGHMRSLRESEAGLVTNKGRGITAPRMKAVDAAALYCAIYASPNIQESATTILELKKLPARGQRRHRGSYAGRDIRQPIISPGLEPEHTVIEGLAALIEVFMSNERLYGYDAADRGRKGAIYARFEIRAPEHSASLTFGEHGYYSEEWVYGRRGELDSIRVGQCSEVTLLRLAACLKA